MFYYENEIPYSRQNQNQMIPGMQTQYPSWATFPQTAQQQGMPGMQPMLPSPAGQITVPGAMVPTTQIPSAISAPPGEQAPQTVQDIQFTPGFLRTQIGRNVRVEFLIGTDSMTDRRGRLMAVGASYILLQEEDTDDILLCDIYSIKFVTFFY